MNLNGKFVNLSQLRDEARLADALAADGELGTFGDHLFTYVNGQPADLDPAKMQPVIDAHAPVRPLTDTEITEKYAQANNHIPPDMPMMQRLTSMMLGLIPRDTVIMQPPPPTTPLP